MVPLSENTECYASPVQREVLLQLAGNPFISNSFFLTGGTALSVFYLHHRTSEDLDLFAVDDIELSQISFWARTVWQEEHAIVRSTRQFLTMLIRGVKVDFVIDPLSHRSQRDRAAFDEKSIMIDTLENIGANKLCTIVSRTEPKDLVDFYFFVKDAPELGFEHLLALASRREALFDDPPTAGYQLEDGLRFVRQHPALLPRLRRAFDLEEMTAFYGDIAKRIYQKGMS